MEARDIIEKAARGKLVESVMASAIGINSPNDLPSNCRDLCQMVYLCLLEYRNPEKIEQCYEKGMLPYLIRKIVKRQYFSGKSEYYHEIVEFGRRSACLAEHPEREGEAIDGALVEEICMGSLSQADKNMMAMYADLRSYRLLAKRMHLDKTTVGEQIVRIRRNVRKIYETMAI